jgi:WD40 repeat protein
LAIAMDAAGSFMATGDRKGELRLWPLDNDPLGWRNEEIDGHAGFLDEEHVYLTGPHGSLSIHRAADGRLVHTRQHSQDHLGTPIRLGSKVWRKVGNEWLGMTADPGPSLRFKPRPDFDPGFSDGGHYVPFWDRTSRRIVVLSPDLEETIATVEGVSVPPNSLFASQDCRILAGRFDKELRLFRLKPTVEEIPFDPLDSRAETVNYSLSPDGSYLILVKDDRSISVWSTATGELVSSVCGRLPLRNAVVTSQARRIIAIDSQGRLYIWDLRRQAFLGSFLLGSDVRAANLELSPAGDRLLVLLAVGRQTYNQARMIDLTGL